MENCHLNPLEISEAIHERIISRSIGFFFRTIDIESKRRAKERQYLAIAKHIGPEAGGQEVSSGCWCPFVSTFYSTRQQAIP